MATLLFYRKPVALNKAAHKEVKIKGNGGSFAFAAKTNSVILAGLEFTEAAKEYPIVFAAAGDKMVPVALLGLRNEENLLVDGEGKWDARYIPAFVRRYPFVLASAGEGKEMTVCIDEEFEGFNKEEGEPLFTSEGGNTPFLDGAIKFLTQYQQQYARTEQFAAHLKGLDLLVNLTAKVEMKDGRQFALNGLYVVDEKKLLGLDDDAALKLYRSGELAWVYSHLLSLGNLGRLVERVPAAEAVDEAS